MISYKGRRHSEAISSHRSTETENATSSEISRRISLGSNFDRKDARPLNPPLTSNAKTRWSSDNSVRPAFIVNNPSTWKSSSQESQNAGRWQSKLIKRQRPPGKLSPHEEVATGNLVPHQEKPNASAEKLAEHIEKVAEGEEEVETTQLQDQELQVPSSPKLRRNRIEGRLSQQGFDESNFKAWKSQMLNEIKEAKSETIKPGEKTRNVNNIESNSNTYDQNLNALKAALVPGKDDKITIGESFKKSSRIFDARLAARKLDQMSLENIEAEQIIPKWKKIPTNAKKQ